MKDGFYVDDQTDKLTLEMLTYNYHYQLFCVVRVEYQYKSGGMIMLENSVTVRLRAAWLC